MTEQEFQDAVIELAEWCQWRIHHDRPARTASGAWRTHIIGDIGFPDLVLLRPPRLIVAELKTQQGQLTAAQERWLLAFAAVPHAEVYLWRPEDLEAIAHILNPGQTTRPDDPAGLIGQASLRL